MIETLLATPESEPQLPHEVERQLVPIYEGAFESFRSDARPVEQLYLSHPSEPYSLRLREELTTEGELRYTATLKDRGTISKDGLARLEIETEISPELYRSYKTPDTPVLRKLRAEVNNNVVIDFFEDGLELCESEDPIALTHFTDRFKVPMADVSGDRFVGSEWRAHLLYRREHDGRETLAPSPELSADDITHSIMSQCMSQSTVTARIAGRSGSGKSTLIRNVSHQLHELGIAHAILSTDDYHRGKSWLDRYKGSEWTEWDAPIVYDTAALAQDIQRLRNGEVIPRRTIDFTSVEPTHEGVVEPTPIILLEGIYSHADELRQADELNFRLLTPPATCMGRRIFRDMRERPQFTPQSNLRYMLEQAEPEYRKQVSVI